MLLHRHRIIPGHMGGTYDAHNIIMLTVEEHAEAHRVLYERHGRWQDRIAWLTLSRQLSESEAKHQARKHWMEDNKSLVHNPTSHAKMALSLTGRKLSEEHKRSIVNSHATRDPMVEKERRRKIGEATKGRVFSPDAIRKMSEAAKARGIPIETMRKAHEARRSSSKT